MSCCYTNRIHTVYSIFAKYYVLITVALFELNVYITLWPSGLYICFHGLHESHTNKFISSSSSSSSSSSPSSNICAKSEWQNLSYNLFVFKHN